MVRIRDPLHGTVTLTQLEERVLDSPQMQRLRGVRQLAMAHLVYPGANHTRFEHSIGTLALADRMSSELALQEDEVEKVRIAALLHDVGHTAFSHEAEAVLSRRLGSHEDLGEKMIASGELCDIISENFSPKEIASLHRTPLGEIISSDIGADRMDYLLRDSHYTGVAYGVVDSDRIASSIDLAKNGLVLHERGLEAAESLLVARFTMFSTVYLHKTVRIASRMLQQAITLALADGTLDAENALLLSDSQMLDLLCCSKNGGEHARRLKARRLWKRAYSLPLSRLHMDAQQAEKLLSERCGCSVLVDVPRLSLEASIRVQIGGGAVPSPARAKQTRAAGDKEGSRAGVGRASGRAGLVPISSCSELVASLEKMQKSRLEALVICEEKNLGKVSEAAGNLFA